MGNVFRWNYLIQLIGKPTKYWEVFMAYSKKVVDKFENTINEPAKYNVGRFDPKEMNVELEWLELLHVEW